MNVIFMINGLGVGGAETQVLTLTNEFIKNGHKVSVITLGKDLRLLNRLNEHANHYNLNISSSFELFKAFYSSFRYIKELQPDVIHAHLFQANLISRFLKYMFPDIKVINTTHCKYRKRKLFYNPYIFYKMSRKYVDFHSAVSIEGYEHLIKNRSISKSKSKIIKNAFDTSKYRIKKEYSISNNFHWIAIGRLNVVKDYSSLFKAV